MAIKALLKAEELFPVLPPMTMQQLLSTAAYFGKCVMHSSDIYRKQQISWCPVSFETLLGFRGPGMRLAPKCRRKSGETIEYKREEMEFLSVCKAAAVHSRVGA